MIRIEISAEPDQLDAHMAALGFARAPRTEWTVLTNTDQSPKPESRTFAYANTDQISVASTGSGATASVSFTEGRIVNGLTGEVFTVSPEGVASAEAPKADAASSPTTPSETSTTTSTSPSTSGAGGELGPMDGARKRGEAGEGHRRRTKAQIEADDSYFASIKDRANAAMAEMDKGVHDHGRPDRSPMASIAEAMQDLADVGAVPQSVADEFKAPSISTGEPRVNPDDEAQDAADEAAEAKSSTTLTHEDLRAAVGRYNKRFGFAAAQKHVPLILGCPVLEVVSDKLAEAIAKLDNAPAPDTAKFTPVAPEPEEVHASIDDVKDAIKKYVKVYDGVEELTDPAKFPNAVADIPRVLEKLFGKGVLTPKLIPPSPANYGKALTAINAELTANSFGRVAK